MKIAYKYFKDTKKPVMFKADFQPSNGLHYPISCVAIGIKDKSYPDQYNFLKGYFYSILDIIDTIIDTSIRSIAIKSRFDGANDKEKLLEMIINKVKESFNKGWNEDYERIKNENKNVFEEK